MQQTPSSPSTRSRLFRLALAVLLGSGSAWFAARAGLRSEACATAAVASVTACCWLTNALPLPVSSLLPALLLPALGAMPAADVAPNYFPDILLLFLGGFILALALERYGLHRRFALRALALLGARPRRVVLGFMLVAMALSMFISNTSTALLMLPVSVAVLEGCPEEQSRRLAPPLLLGLAYSCSIGGVATPIGTAPNAVLLGQLGTTFPEAPVIGFGTWMLGTLPFCLGFLLTAWFVLTRLQARLPAEPFSGLSGFAEERRLAGARSPEQNRVLLVFGLVALLWMTRQGADFGSVRIPGWQSLLPERTRGTLSDSTVALLGVVLLFVLPGRAPRTGALLDWEDCVRVPWGILLLLGGGFALARAIEASGLSAALGESLEGAVTALPPMATIFVASLAVTFLTEITSNTATINVMLPLLFSASVSAGVHPMLMALPCTLAVSCAFMLPVATPPNAILFSSGRLTIPQMARAGFSLNLCTAVLVTLFVWYWIAPRWGMDFAVLPDWAR